MLRTRLCLIGCLTILSVAASANGQVQLPPDPGPNPAAELPGSSAVPGSSSLSVPTPMSVPTLPAPGIGQPSQIYPPSPIQTQGMPGYPMPTQGFAYPPAQIPQYGAAPLAQQAPYYWRVGTRSCGQSFAEGICDCQLTVQGCGPDGRWRTASEAEMMAALQQGGPICVMTHGSLVDESGSRVDSRGTYRWLRNTAPQMPLHVIFFDWPSHRCIGPLAAIQFIKLGRQAARNGFALAKLVGRLPADSSVCLMGHSHGARVVCAATHLMGGGEVQGRTLAQPDRHHRLRLVLAAAAIDHHWLNPGERYSQAIGRAENIVSIENSADFALHLYPLQRPLGVAALGARGLWGSDERALGACRSKIYHLDVTSLIGKGHLWPNYYCHPQIAQTIAPSVFFPQTYGAPQLGSYPTATIRR